MEMLQAQLLNDVETRRNTRDITYMIYCALTDPKDRKDIVAFSPLPGDEYNPQDVRSGILSRLAARGVKIKNGKIVVEKPEQQR